MRGATAHARARTAAVALLAFVCLFFSHASFAIGPGSSTAPIGAGHGLATSGPHGAAPQTFTGSSLGNFSSSNTVRTATGVSLDYRPGKTLILGLTITGTPASGLGVVIGSYDTTALHGWELELPAVRAGCSTGNCLWMISDSSEWETTLSLGIGFHTLCLAWRSSDNAIEVTIDGVWEGAQATLSAPSSPTSNWNAFIGYPNNELSASRGALVGRVAWAEVQASQFTPAQCRAATYTSGNRFLPTSTASTGATFDYRTAAHYASPSFTSGGSSPLTFTVAGSPTRYALGETRYPAAYFDKFYFDGDAFVEHHADSSTAWTVHAPLTHLRASSTAGTVAVEGYTTEAWPKTQLAAYLNGSFSGAVLLEDVTYTGGVVPPIQPHSPEMAVFGGAEGSNVWDLWAGDCDTNDYVSQPYDPTYGGRWCTSPIAIRLPTLLNDGVTLATNAFLTRRSAPTHRVMFLGEALLTWNATNIAQTSVIGLLRQTYTYPTDGITYIGGASLAMGEFYARGGYGGSAPNVNDATSGVQNSITAIVNSLDGTTTNTVWDSLMRGDCQGPVGDTPANFQTKTAAVLTSVCIAKPGTVFYLQGAVQNPNGETCVDAVHTMDDFRTAASNVAIGSCPVGCTCHYVNCGGGACVNNANYGGGIGGGVFLTDTGQAQYEAAIVSSLTAANACGTGVHCL